MSWISRNGYLTTAEMENNAQLVANFSKAQGWTKTACAAMLGNMQAESGINPGIWENLTPYQGGYGLTQWTPYTKYSTWATGEGYTWEDNGNAEMERILYEVQNDLQWFYNAELGIPTPCTFQQFMEDDLYNLQDSTNFWLWFYEHPADPGPATQATRYSYAQNWYNYIDYMGIPVWLLFKFSEWRRL